MKKMVMMSMILIGIAVTGVHAQINQALVGSWDWVEGHMPGVLVLHADGNYFWVGVDYGVQGWRWSSRGGTVWSTHASLGTGAFFHYRLVDANTLRIEYADLAVQMGISGVFYLRRGR
ncbi:MAG: hypothetical protein FWB99_05690 [Treponema sp.]|nr:hypothetical protein [Treponema sp.]